LQKLLSSPAEIRQFCNAAIFIAAVFSASACHAPSRAALTGQASDEWVRTYTLVEGGEVQITNGDGDVQVQAADGNTVDVRVERIVKASSDVAAAEIVSRIAIKEEITAGKVVLRTEGLSGIVIGVSTEVRYHVRVPRNAVVRIRADGTLTARGLAGRAILTAVNGGLMAEGLSGGVEARSTNGGATISLAAFGDDLVDIRVTNGSLTLAIPETANANLTASATNGTIDVSALKLESLGEQTTRRVRGRLNAGGTPIEVVTTNGNIVVKTLGVVSP
jgi:hypothetical protein